MTWSSEHGEILRASLTSGAVLAGPQDIAVTIHMPGGPVERPPLSLAIVLDRSGSMHGQPLENAKAAATTLVRSLATGDAFALVTFSDTDQLVLQMTRATAEAKAAAAAAIDRIYDDGGTCTSCGIDRGAEQLAHSPIHGGVQRMVLISDGQANEGIWDRDELVGLAQTTAAGGVSISTVGVGLDFDEQTMIRLGEVGHGNYYFVEDTARLASMFATELAGIGTTVATNVQLEVEAAAPSTIDSAYGYPLTAIDDHTVRIPIADLRSGETRKVVLHGVVRGPGVARFRLTWRSPQADAADDRAIAGETLPRSATATLVTELTEDPARVAATQDLDATAAVEEARTARVLDEATRTYEQYGAEAAQRVIEKQLAHVRHAGIAPAHLDRIERAADGAIHSFAQAPADQAKKATRTTAYELAR